MANKGFLTWDIRFGEFGVEGCRVAMEASTGVCNYFLRRHFTGFCTETTNIVEAFYREYAGN